MEIDLEPGQAQLYIKLQLRSGKLTHLTKHPKPFLRRFMKPGHGIPNHNALSHPFRLAEDHWLGSANHGS